MSWEDNNGIIICMIQTQSRFAGKNLTLKMESLWLDFFIQVSRFFLSKAMTSTGANKCNIELGSQYEITRFIWEKWNESSWTVDALNPLCPPGSHQLWTPGSVKIGTNTCHQEWKVTWPIVTLRRARLSCCELWIAPKRRERGVTAPLESQNTGSHLGAGESDLQS